MRKTKASGIVHRAYYGALTLPNQTRTGKLPPDFTMNSPVGIHTDHCGQVWVCDTGNSRILVFSSDLSALLHIIDGPGKATPSAPRLLMPFHLCPHPTDKLMYCTDLGNGRIVAFAYDHSSVKFAFAFGDQPAKRFVPLTDPNGIAIVREKSGRHFVYVCDEFFHTKGDQRSRCVKFTLDGKYVTQFRGVKDPNGKHDLLWPQGIAADSQGNLYIANTGNYQVLKIDSAWPIRNGVVESPRESALLHSFGSPAGIGKFNVMRSVCVIDDRVFVPDHVENAISIYDGQGKLQTTVSGQMPLYDHNVESARTLSDLMFSALEDVVFVGPYQVCAAAEPDTYYITEPFASSVLKVSMAAANGGTTEEALLLKAVGHRRDDKSLRQASSQFNCMTAVLGIDPAHDAVSAAVPATRRANGDWLDTWATAAGSTYRYWYDKARTQLSLDPMGRLGSNSLNIDSGNWCLKTFDVANSPIRQQPGLMRGMFVPGDLAMALYYPQQPLLGQICPGTPLLFVTNFNACFVTMYQFGPGGHLLNYGLPFGVPGIGGEGTLKAPQGIAVNSLGEIFIADSLNNRISKWRIHATGLVTFCKNFRWTENGTELMSFAPCDVAVDANDRVYVCDQFNNCLRAFDRDGKSLWSYGQPGYCDDMRTEHANFYLPASLCVEGRHLFVNDLVNRALKIFEIEENGLKFVNGQVFFKQYPENGGVWMPYFIYARNGRLFVPDSTFNVVNVFDY